ncbi:MAG TPA: hypothetical protein VFD71_09005 [Planctomycetota bacterium]|jgi:uncharacterized membrane protein YeaQ/YmgE (transglycosylase-associated protein family)|nr:hypothetical protein [Planctomycetota bacterium]
MTILEFLILLLVAGVCGAIGQALAGASRGGFLVAVALGFVGALLGVWIARGLKLPEIFVIRLGNVDFPIVWSIIGATLFVLVISLVQRSRK